MRGSMGAFARHRRAFHVRPQDVCRSSAGSSCAEQSEKAKDRLPESSCSARAPVAMVWSGRNDGQG